MKTIFTLLVGILLAACSKTTVEPKWGDKYGLKAVPYRADAMEVTPEQADRMMHLDTLPTTIHKGGRIVINDNVWYSDLNLYTPSYPMTIRVQVIYLYCSEDNRFLKGAVVSKAVENHTKFEYQEYDANYTVSTDGKTLHYEFSGAIFYYLNVQHTTYYIENIIGVGGDLKNTCIKVKPDGNKCPDWYKMIEIQPILFDREPDN